MPADAIHSGASLELKNRYAGIHVHPAEELYDLEEDPDEMVNLADAPTHQDTKNDLRRSLANWMVETAAPFSGGPSPVVSSTDNWLRWGFRYHSAVQSTPKAHPTTRATGNDPSQRSV